jgi:L-lactate utilization protein LutB/heterodisulfide reductase subunit B
VDFSSELEKKTRRAIEHSEHLEPMRAAFRSVLEKQRLSEPCILDLAQRRERLKRVREACIGNVALLEKAIENLEANGFRVRRAADAAEAVSIVLDEMGGEKLLVKSKSNLSKEIDLTSALGDAGVEVVETDIGDRIIQLSGEPTVHPTGPCAQLTRQDISRVLSEHLGREVEPEPAKLIEAVRSDLLPRIESARIGLTGVNAIAATEGAVLLMHNEGNIDLVSQRTGKLILLAAPEKVYPDLDEAINLAKVEPYFATGQPLTTFIRIIAGPSKTADIEKEIYYGVHGPRELVVIILDNGRTGLAADEELRPVLECIGCGACLLECPVYDIVGPEYGAPGHLGGIGACAESGLHGLERSVGSGISWCLTCRNCVERCPLSLDVPALVEKVRRESTREKLLPLEQHKPLVSSVRNYSNPWMQPRRNRNVWAKGLGIEGPRRTSTIFFAGCSLSFVARDVAVASARLLEALGMRPLYLGREESCCGSPLLRLGEEDLFLELARANIERFRVPGVTDVVTVCPGCLKALREYGDYFPTFDLRVRHISEVLAEAVDAGSLKMRTPEPRLVTYHDPCHLGRGCGIYEEPRRVLEAIEGLELVEMPRSREFSACCGSGGGVKTAFPELALAIGEKRRDMAEAAGASAIVTSCPWCESNLTDAMNAGDYRVPVWDLVELAFDCRLEE